MDDDIVTTSIYDLPVYRALRAAMDQQARAMPYLKRLDIELVGNLTIATPELRRAALAEMIAVSTQARAELKRYEEMLTEVLA